jgi:hypothetical protein
VFRNVWPRVAASLVSLAILVALAACASRSDLSQSQQTSYVDDNQRLLDSLPQIPGSERIDVQSNPYCSASSPIGYSTFEHHRTATVMTHNAIVDFYAQNLGSDWKQISRDDVPIDLPSPLPGIHGTDTEVRFQRGDETIFLAIIPIEGSWPNLTIHSPNDYSLGVDAHRPGNLNCHNG